MNLEKLSKPLAEEDIELRVGMGRKASNFFTILLYKTARIDRARLDEAVGKLNWCNKHYVDEKGNVICQIGVYDDTKKQWVFKEDTGTESKTEKEKGAYSDSFKRAGSRWGIGIELYETPNITIFNWSEWKTEKIPKVYFDKWRVKFLDKDKGILGGFEIYDDKNNRVFNTTGSLPQKKQKAPKKRTSKPKSNKSSDKFSEQENIKFVKNNIKDTAAKIKEVSPDFDLAKYAEEKKIKKEFKPSLSQLKQAEELLNIKYKQLLKEK